jgi:hypothetical protein
MEAQQGGPIARSASLPEAGIHAHVARSLHSPWSTPASYPSLLSQAALASSLPTSHMVDPGILGGLKVKSCGRFLMLRVQTDRGIV